MHDPFAELWELHKRASQEARRAEGVVAEAIRIAFGVSDADVIQQFDFDDLGRFVQNPRHAEVMEPRSSRWAGPVLEPAPQAKQVTASIVAMLDRVHQFRNKKAPASPLR